MSIKYYSNTLSEVLEIYAEFFIFCMQHVYIHAREQVTTYSEFVKIGC
jgi:hypothetical protein